MAFNRLPKQPVEDMCDRAIVCAVSDRETCAWDRRKRVAEDPGGPYPRSCVRLRPAWSRRSRCTCSSRGCWCTRGRSPHCSHSHTHPCLWKKGTTRKIMRNRTYFAFCFYLSFFFYLDISTSQHKVNGHLETNKVQSWNWSGLNSNIVLQVTGFPCTSSKVENLM